jgi:phosphatidylglycerophosphate synthase
MEAQVGWGAAMILMALMAAHAAEEIVAAGRLSCMEGCSAAVRIKAWVGDRIGPLLLLVAVALAGVLVHAFWIWLALGIIAADLAQHAARSIRVRAYTPGVATGAFLAVYVLAFVGGSLTGPSWARPSSWGALVIGIAFVAVGYLSAQRKRLFKSQRSAGEP